MDQFILSQHDAIFGNITKEQISNHKAAIVLRQIANDLENDATSQFSLSVKVTNYKIGLALDLAN